LPENAWRAQQEFDLQIALGRALMATRGYASPAVAETFVRARALAEQLDRPDYLVPVLHSQWAFHLVRGEHKLALSLAERAEKVGAAQNDEAALLLGYLSHGNSRLFLGDFVAARALLEQCHGLRNPAHRAVYASLTTQDPYAMSLGILAGTMAYLGYVDQARARVDEALSEARRVDHAYTLAYVLFWACWTAWVGRSPDEMQQHAEELIALSSKHSFQYRFGWGLVCRGGSMNALGQAEEGLPLITQGLKVLVDTGASVGTPWALMLLAEANAELGQPIKALDHLAAAAQIMETTDERHNEAELLRLRAELLIATGDQADAEQNYDRALAVARRQSARVFELRASIGLARLWCDQGKGTEARDLLAPIYGWFTEGFDTPDLKEAKALLDELAS
jgi:predicted ATPase